MAVLNAHDGATLLFDDVGQGRPVLLVHGWGANASFFRAQRAALAGQFRVITPDLRGHGRSAAAGAVAADAMTLDTLARDLGALVDALGLDDVLAVGWSMGALLLWRLLDLPAGARITGQVIVDMAPRVLNDAHWQLGLRQGHTEADTEAMVAGIVADWPAFVDRVAARILADGRAAQDPELHAWCAAQFRANPPALMAALWRSLVAEDARPHLARRTPPALVLAGARSQLYDAATARALARALPDAQCITFDRSGHAPHLEEPDRFNQLLARFAARQPIDHVVHA